MPNPPVPPHVGPPQPIIYSPKPQPLPSIIRRPPYIMYLKPTNDTLAPVAQVAPPPRDINNVPLRNTIVPRPYPNYPQRPYVRPQRILPRFRALPLMRPNQIFSFEPSIQARLGSISGKIALPLRLGRRSVDSSQSGIEQIGTGNQNLIGNIQQIQLGSSSTKKNSKRRQILL